MLSSGHFLVLQDKSETHTALKDFSSQLIFLFSFSVETINKNNESCWQSVLTTLEVLSSVCKNPSMTKLVLPEIWAWLENLLRGEAGIYFFIFY